LVYAGAVLLVPLWLPALLERRLRLGEECFTFAAQLLSLVPGKPGIFARRSFYLMTIDRCATNCHIGFATTLSHPQVSIGAGVMIGHRCTIGNAVIGRDATIGSNVDILSGRRQHAFDRTDRPIQDQGGQFTQVRIGPNCWIGNSAVVMSDVGPHCVIGAGAVVVKPIPANAIAVGNPAVVKRMRH
jgi:acetyltransferase-like isoleucine patch superfamily enzyme